MTPTSRSEASNDPKGESAPSSSVAFSEVLRPPGERNLRRLPKLVAQAFSLVWLAARRELMIAGALQLVGAVSLAAQLLVMRRVLDRVVGVDESVGVLELLPELLAFGVLLLVVAVALVSQREQQRTLAELVEKYTTGRVMDVSTTALLIDYDRPAFYDRLQRAQLNASARPLQIATGVIGLLGSGASVAMVGGALLWIEPVVAMLILLGAIPSLYLNRRAARVLHDHMVRQTPNQRRRSYLYQVLSRKEEAQEIRAFDSSSELRADHDRLFDEKIADLRITIRQRLFYGTVSASIIAAVTVGSLALLLVFIQIGRLNIGDAAVALGAVVIVAGRLRSLVTSANSLHEGALFLEDFTDFVLAGQQMANADRGPSPGAFGTIELDGVGFTYPSRSAPSLSDVSLTIRRGEVIALVGENGSGKTTLTKLLAGLYVPSAGTIRWDDVDTRDLDPGGVREQVTVIFQDFARYFLTAEENVSISRIDAKDDHFGVKEACARAGAHAFLSELQDGYSTLLGPSFAGGSDLSTGQWQRIALARAYFRDAPLLILDEPTAALDPRGEYEIFQQVRALAKDHTVVLVSHRFSSVRAADRILVLETGRIVEEGGHDELMARGGLYAELFELQASGYGPSPDGSEGVAPS